MPCPAHIKGVVAFDEESCDNPFSIWNKVVSGYNNAPVLATVEQKRKLQQNKLNLQNSIQTSLAYAKCLKLEVGLPYVNFKTIGDYIILMCYYLKMLKVSKTEIKAFIRDFEKITDNYRQVVSPNVAAMVIHPDLASRMDILKNYI